MSAVCRVAFLQVLLQARMLERAANQQLNSSASQREQQE